MNIHQLVPTVSLLLLAAPVFAQTTFTSPNGFDTKVMRIVIKQRKKDRVEREEEQAMVDLYMNALGMLQGDEVDKAA